MTEIKRTMIASLLIEQATEMKGKRPSELGFEDLVDVVQAIVKNLRLGVVVGRSEQLTCEHDYQPDTTCGVDITCCTKCGDII